MWLVAYKYRDSRDSMTVVKGVDEFITEILTKVNATQFAGFVGGTRCFRYDIAKHKPYKGNRPEKPEFMVKWEGIIKHHMIKKWGFIVCDGVEADDAVSICAYQLPETHNPIVCHVDKDLDQIPGNHFNYQKHTFYKVTEEEAWRRKLLLVLTGDGTDNIAGLPGIGETKAKTFLTGKTYDDCYKAVRAGFIKYYAEYYGDIIFRETRDLVYTLTEEQYGFEMPQYQPWSTSRLLNEKEVVDIDFSLFD